MTKTITDYITRINLIKSSFLDATWNVGNGWYQTADPVDGTIRPYTWLSIFMVQTTAILAGRGDATSADIIRAVAVINKLITSPCYVNNTWTHLMTGDSDYHEAVDQPVAECLFYAWKYRAQLGLDTATISALVSILTVDRPIGSSLYGNGHNLSIDAGVGTYDNQSTAKWKLNRLAYAYLVSGPPFDAEFAACLKRFLYYRDKPTSTPSATWSSNLFPDWGWRYIDQMPWNSLEYNQMCLGGALLYYPDIPNVGLSDAEISYMRAWQRHNLGGWQRNGYPNWDTVWSNGRIHNLSYWLWSLRALMGMSRNSNLTMTTDDAAKARWLLDKAMDTLEYMERWNSDPLDHADSREPLGVGWAAGAFEGTHHYNNVKASGMAKLVMELAMVVDLGIVDVSAVEPVTIWGWNWTSQDVHISTATYSAASLPYAPYVGTWGADAVQSPGDGVSRIQLPTNEILTNMGGYDQEAHSFKVVRNGVTEINTGSVNAGKPISQQIWRDGIEQTRSNYDTSVIPVDFADCIKSLVKRNGANYQTEVETEFFKNFITTTHRVIRVGIPGTGHAVVSFPCRKNVVMDYVSADGTKIVVWDGAAISPAGSPDPSACKYIHLKWVNTPGSGISAGILLVPTAGMVAIGAKVTALSYNPSGYPQRQPDQDRSLLIYLADGAANMEDVALTYDIRITDGTDTVADNIYQQYYVNLLPPVATQFTEIIPRILTVQGYRPVRRRMLVGR